ncbi:MAG TPA: hypothetical protein VLL54_01455 [Pyrinomonadaceae bacterium]|nr:hypothetical protein [Pyrinomonadaceae bacterium]
MKNQHIINLIEDSSTGSLTEANLKAIQAHVGECSDCRLAFQAAQVSHALIKEHAAAEFAPPPFFHTRVLASLRERQAADESWSFARLWRAAGVLASSMVATFAVLAVLTFAVPETQQVSSLNNVYSAEEVILNQSSQPDDESDVQLLTTIYGGEDESSK